MKAQDLTAIYDNWSRASYARRVRGTATLTYLWGSSGINENFDKPLVLHIRNDALGEEITLGTKIASGDPAIIGTLSAGECISISVQGISGVFATCVLDSVVACMINRST